MRGAVPFLKWVGGKSRLLGYLVPLVKGDRLVEPFVGAGAVFLGFQELFGRIRINDANADLMNCYTMIKEQFDEFYAVYLRVCRAYFATKEKESMYYGLRSLFNASKLSNVERAACMIVLNKTGYNGLYRVNGSGELNVAWGKNENPRFARKAELEDVAAVLERTELSCGDFEDVEVTHGDFVYFDPPYHGTYNSYTAGGFGYDDLFRLKDMMIRLDGEGIGFAMSNSYFLNIDNWFPHEWVRSVTNGSSMAQGSIDRGQVGEVIVSNRWR